jgi:HD superfamily phosphohydrolase
MLQDRVFSDQEPYLARLDGATDTLWEPLWRLRTPLRPAERGLLTAKPLRRLHFVRHGGASFLSTHHVHSRLQHTLGVFALAAHFCPEDERLRAAALLHDVGHPPFSHALEGLEQIDHHRWTRGRVLSEPIADVLLDHGLDPRSVWACIGEETNLLHNKEGILQADHLDSWVRSAHVSGLLPRSAPDILSRLRLGKAHLEMDRQTAELVAELIVAEARFHTSAANAGPNVMLKHLVGRLLECGALGVEALPTMTDGELEQTLFSTPATAEEARRLWYRPDEIIVRRIDRREPPHAHIETVDELYLDMPLTEGQVVTRVSPAAAALLKKARQWLGTYAVYWETDRTVQPSAPD